MLRWVRVFYCKKSTLSQSIEHQPQPITRALNWYIRNSSELNAAASKSNTTSLPPAILMLRVLGVKGEESGALQCSEAERMLGWG